MHIGIDAHMVGERETGNENYISGILSGLKQVDTQHDYYVFVQKESQELLSHLEQLNFHLVNQIPSNALIRNAISLPRKAREHALDILFVTYTAPLFCPCPIVLAVHDISYVHFPEFFPPRVRLQLSTLIPWSLQQASHVTVLSEYTKRDIMEHYGVPEDKITVTYLSAHERFRPIERSHALNQLQQRYSVGEHFILTVGNLQPRKNIPRLIQAFAQLRRTGKIDHQLVIIGQDLWYAESVRQTVQALGVENEILFTGYVADEDLPLWYNAADLFVYPSIFEGFGIPPLEAMRCGTTTITSNASSLPEVIGEATLSFDPYDVEELSHTIYTVLSDENLRERLAKQCLERSRVFSWEHSAQILLKVFERIDSKKHYQ